MSLHIKKTQTSEKAVENSRGLLCSVYAYTIIKAYKSEREVENSWSLLCISYGYTLI